MRHLKIGILVAIVIASIVTASGLMSWNQPPGFVVQILTLPSFPVLYALFQFYPPGPGESKISPWDYLMLTVVVIVSSLFWGIIAGLLSKYVFRRRKKLA